MIRTAVPEDLPTLAAVAAGYQADPSTHSAYVGTDAAGIAAEITAIDDWTAVSAVAGDDSVLGWLIGEPEPELGRVWWIGPFGPRSTWDDLLAHAQALLPMGIDQEEFAIDAAALGIAEWADRHGFVRAPGSAVLSVELPLSHSQVVAVRPVTPSDRDTIGVLHGELFPDTHMTPRQLVEDPDVLHPRFVAEADGAPVGYVAVERQPDGNGYVDFVGVHPDHRGRGFGRDLIAAGAAALADLGCNEIHLSVREANTAARALYASLGFTEERVVVPLRKGFTIK